MFVNSVREYSQFNNKYIISLQKISAKVLSK